MISKQTETQRESFVRTVEDFYDTHGRHDLPWRQTRDPYSILVSELMLQQTQVVRVRQKYELFLTHFPDVSSLAAASLGDVLRLWQGLGYNRRAKYLHEAAKLIVREYRGVLPNKSETLRALPGVGRYTAAAVAAFAYDEPVVMIETNIRTAYIHHFYAKQESVSDTMLEPLIAATLQNPSSRWYAALMDYGSHLKATVGNKNTQSKSYKKQSTFKGSAREMRGRILKFLTERPYRRQEFDAMFLTQKECYKDQLDQLVAEGLVQEKSGVISLP